MYRNTRVARCIALVAVLMGAPLAAARADELQDVAKLVAGGKLDEAEKRADAFLVKTPKDAQMRFLKGVILSQRGKRDDAAVVFTGITQDYPELPEPYNNLAVIYAAQGNYDKARLSLETSLRVAPNYATAYENLGDVYTALAARSYQDARRYDANNAAALRKLTAARALLTAVPAVPKPADASAATPAAAPAPTPAPAPAAVAEPTRSQLNVGLPSPAGPRVTVGGFGAVAPEIIVAADAPEVPLGSNVVAIQEAPRAAAAATPADTSPLAGVRTVVAADPGAPVAAVTAAVERWAKDRSVTTSNLQVRVDGDAATARFRETSTKGQQPVAANRALTLRRNGETWAVVGERTES